MAKYINVLENTTIVFRTTCLFVFRIVTLIDASSYNKIPIHIKMPISNYRTYEIQDIIDPEHEIWAFKIGGNRKRSTNADQKAIETVFRLRFGIFAFVAK